MSPTSGKPEPVLRWMAAETGSAWEYRVMGEGESWSPGSMVLGFVQQVTDLQGALMWEAYDACQDAEAGLPVHLINSSQYRQVWPSQRINGAYYQMCDAISAVESSVRLRFSALFS